MVILPLLGSNLAEKKLPEKPPGDLNPFSKRGFVIHTLSLRATLDNLGYPNDCILDSTSNYSSHACRQMNDTISMILELVTFV